MARDEDFGAAGSVFGGGKVASQDRLNAQERQETARHNRKLNSLRRFSDVEDKVFEPPPAPGVVSLLLDGGDIPECATRRTFSVVTCHAGFNERFSLLAEMLPDLSREVVVRARPGEELGDAAHERSSCFSQGKHTRNGSVHPLKARDFGFEVVASFCRDPVEANLAVRGRN